MAREKKMLEHKSYRNSPMTDDALNVEAGDNAKYLNFSMEVMALPDIDMHDVAQVNARITQYFQICANYDLKPTVSGFAMSLNGMDRRRLWELVTGSHSTVREVNTLPRDCVDSVKKAYKSLEILWENYMQNGKINPVSGIFLGKNNYGYQDKTEYVVTPGQQEESVPSVEEIRKRYLPESERLALEQAHDASLAQEIE